MNEAEQRFYYLYMHAIKNGHHIGEEMEATFAKLVSKNFSDKESVEIAKEIYKYKCHFMTTGARSASNGLRP